MGGLNPTPVRESTSTMSPWPHHCSTSITSGRRPKPSSSDAAAAAAAAAAADGAIGEAEAARPDERNSSVLSSVLDSSVTVQK